MDDIASQNHQTKDNLEIISKNLKSYSAQQVKTVFSLNTNDILYKTTISVCEECLVHTKAVVFENKNKVWIRSVCNKHGSFTNLLENDAKFYRLSNKDIWGNRYIDENEFFIPEYSSCCSGGSASSCVTKPDSFTNQLSNKSCTVLVEITNACNLACRVCYADASGDKILPFVQFKEYIDKLIKEKSFIDSVQVTGGEATIHPQFWEMIEWLYEKKEIGIIYIPTNGLEFSKPDVAIKLKRMRKKILVLLQFDGEQKTTNQSLRKADVLKTRKKAIELLAKYKVCMQLTMTVAHNLSEAEISWVMQQGLKHKHIRLIGFLPTFYTGRYKLEKDGKNRPTLSTVVHGLVKALPKKLKLSDFTPIPCSHPNCGWTTLFARRFGLLFNITQKINLTEVMNEVAYKTKLDKDEIQAVMGTGKTSFFRKMITKVAKMFIRPQDIFGIAIKPFMDQHNYDMDRVSNCCHHILNTNGDLVSFCEYNTQIRMNDTWKNKPNIFGRHEKIALSIKNKSRLEETEC